MFRMMVVEEVIPNGDRIGDHWGSRTVLNWNHIVLDHRGVVHQSTRLPDIRDEREVVVCRVLLGGNAPFRMPKSGLHVLDVLQRM